MAEGGRGAPTRPSGSLGRYALAVAITVGAILSQYFVPELFPATGAIYGNLPGDLFVVYGIPTIAFLGLVGTAPIAHWATRMRVAVVEGLRWYGGLSLLGLVVVIGLAALYLLIDPSALGLVNRPNPALQQASANPWFFVGFSFVIGAFEETIFRGWIFGYWRNRAASWVAPAVATSVLFAFVHLYYAATYLAAAPLFFPQLFLLGFAFAATYHYSGGNLVVVALLHGVQDATAFLTIVPGPAAALGLPLHYLVILVGGVVALYVYAQRDDSHRSGPLRPIAGFGPPRDSSSPFPDARND